MSGSLKVSRHQSSPLDSTHSDNVSRQEHQLLASASIFAVASCRPQADIEVFRSLISLPLAFCIISQRGVPAPAFGEHSITTICGTLDIGPRQGSAFRT